MERLIEKFPHKYCEIQDVSTEDELEVTLDSYNITGKGAKKKKRLNIVSKKNPTGVKSPVNRGKEPSEWANILFLNSGDNGMADFTQNALNKKYNLTVTPGSNQCLCNEMCNVMSLLSNSSF